MDDLFDYLAAIQESDIDNNNIYTEMKDIIFEEAIENIDSLSEGALTRLGVKILLDKKRQDKMISGNPINSNTSTTYNIMDVNREIECIEWHLKYNKKLEDDQAKELKSYLSKLKKRYVSLGGDKVLRDLKGKRSFESLKMAARAYLLTRKNK